MKRAFDVLVSSTALIVLSPLLLIIAAAIWLDTKSPIIFSQERMGKDFRPFKIWKFRTMKVSNAGSPVTVSGDVRVTRVGRILRLSKLDELPQFANVLCGHMSIVGPRPEIPKYASLFHSRFQRVLRVRPGITDIASIYFRNEEQILANSQDPLREYEERILPMKLDLADRYIDNHTIAQDLKIILQTLAVLIYPSASGKMR